MKIKFALLGSIALILFRFQTIAPAQPPQTNQPHGLPAYWRLPAPGQRPYTLDNKKMPLLAVKGNKFVNTNGDAVLLRGMSISDPDKIESQGHWSRDHFVKIQELGATVVRIPIHPAAWRGRGPVEYIKLLDQAVGWCTELNMYVIIDWHSIGNLETEVFQDPVYETTKHETFNFWRTMARHYAGHNTVAFFELFNEPTTFRDTLGPVSWADWKKTCEEEIKLIRASDPQAIPLVAGFDWAYDLTPVELSPIDAPGIAYTVHPYSNKRSKPWPAHWDEDFGFVAQRYPVFATEFGGFARPAAMDGQSSEDNPPDGSTPNSEYGPVIIKYLEGKGISWSVWCFDPEWRPSLIKNWNYDLTPSGEFVKGALRGGVK